MPWESDLLMCALQNLTVGVAVLDDKGRVIFANEMLASMLDISHDELKGSTFPHIEALEKTAPTQFRVVNRDGDERTLMASVSPMERAKHDISPLLVTVNDVTEQKKKEYSLQQMVHEIVCFRNVAKLFSQTDIPLEHVLNTFVHMIPEGWEYPSITAASVKLGETVVSSANYVDTEWKQTSKFSYGDGLNGTLEVCYLEKRPTVDEGPFSNEQRILIETLANELERYIQRKRNEDIRRQQHRELETYSKLLRHDLRNDLSVIIGNHEILKMMLTSPDEMLKEVLSSSEAVFERMMSLLKAFGRSAESIERHVATLLRDVASQAERAHSNICIDFKIDKEAKDLRIAGSRLLPMVFENLFRNSAVHAGENPHIDVMLSREGNNAQIVITDDGPGISEEIRDRLFEKGVSTRGGGLGLYLSKQVIEATDGSIELMDSREDSGASFRILVPISV